jgi:hypothetical protein
MRQGPWRFWSFHHFITDDGTRSVWISELLTAAPRPADINCDGIVDGADLGMILGLWWSTACTGCGADLNHDGVVDGADLGLLLPDFFSTTDPCCGTASSTHCP